MRIWTRVLAVMACATMSALGAGKAHEANPFFAPVTGTPVATDAKLVFWTAVAGTLLYAGVASTIHG